MLDNLPRGTICIEDIEMGMVRYLRKQVTDEDIEMFAKVSTDHNPVHLDDDYAQDTMFQGRIAHGMLTAGLISAVIGEQLPGHGTIYMSQSLKFLAPVRPGDLDFRLPTSTAEAEARPPTARTSCHPSVRSPPAVTTTTASVLTLISLACTTCPVRSVTVPGSACAFDSNPETELEDEGAFQYAGKPASGSSDFQQSEDTALAGNAITA